MNVDLLRIIERSELRVMLCDSCGEPCLAAKRSLCCGDSVRQIPEGTPITPIPEAREQTR